MLAYLRYKLNPVLLIFGLGLVCFALGGAKAQASEQETVKVCAVPQLYSALNHLYQKDENVSLYFATANELYALISNHEGVCDLLLASDERLPITLIRAQKAVASSLVPFARAPLVLWTKQQKLIDQNKPLEQLIKDRKVKSLAVAKANLTPVGFASNEVLKSSKLKLDYLKNNLYKSEHEYQVYSMVDQGNVDLGLISLPLITNPKHKIDGIYFEIPRNIHPDILYYALLMQKSKDCKACQKFIKKLLSDSETQNSLKSFGFYALTPEN